MKSKKTKLSFTKTTVVNLADIRGGKANEAEKSITIVQLSCATNCALQTVCYAISECRTQCGPGGMLC